MRCLQEYTWVKKTIKKLGDIKVNDHKAQGVMTITSVRIYESYYGGKRIHVDVKFKGTIRRYISGSEFTYSDTMYMSKVRRNRMIRSGVFNSVAGILKYFDIVRHVNSDVTIKKIDWVG